MFGNKEGSKKEHVFKVSFIKESFPHVKLIKASAGTGKTYTLSKRIVELLLSDVANNQLRNILGITFTVNATKEMKERVIGWLKSIVILDNNVLSELDIPNDKVHFFREKAEIIIDDIITNYGDFQIKTIDSFLTSVFKASAIEFGYPENFDILLDSSEYMKKAFDAYIENIDEKNETFFNFFDLMSANEATFSFTPQNRILDKIRELYIKKRRYKDGFLNDDKDIEWQQIKLDMKATVNKMLDVVNKYDIKVNGSASFKNVVKHILEDDYNALFKAKMEKPPVTKVGKNIQKEEELNRLWLILKEQVITAKLLYSEMYYYPYLSILKEFEQILDGIVKREEVIFIEDVPSVIVNNIEQFYLIPDVYVRLGGRLFHYFIDEFQDTSPIQWDNLKIFIDNALSQGGTLFVVGDTKQAIYSFRDTDYEIMANLEKSNPFPSVSDYRVETLLENHRSGENILFYVKEVFEKAKTSYQRYSGSGLFDWDFALTEKLKGKGYVKALIIEKSADSDEAPEKAYLKEVIGDLIRRGYSYGDIAIVAHKNENIVEISSWLSEFEMPFLSFSSLNILKRKVIQEIIAFSKFLDNPSDNLSFAFFLKGEILNKLCGGDFVADTFILHNKNADFLYKSFQKNYATLWQNYFEKPFQYVGYLPIYELICFIIKTFNIHRNFPEESGAIVKLLEIVKEVEVRGKNSLKELIAFLKKGEEEEEKETFELSTPQNADAIKLMTVHKAKGLGFPVAIYFLYPLKGGADNLKIGKIDEKLKVLRINKNLIDNQQLKEIYEKSEVKSKINDLNSIYVGLTRAKEELYVIGIKEAGKEEKKFPIDLIVEKELGEKIVKISKLELPSSMDVEITLSEELMIQSATSDKIAFDEKRRGEFIHQVLSCISDIRENDKDKISEIAKIFYEGYSEIDFDKIVDEILGFLTDDKIRPFFEKSGEALFLEKDFVSSDGQILRIDRLLVDKDMVMVIDFKTGEKNEAYSKQLEKYGMVIKEIYDRPVKCFILYFDSKEVEMVYEC